MKLFQCVLVMLLSLFVIGCEKNNLASQDVQFEIPLLSNALVSPDSIYLDSLTPAGGLYSVSSVVNVRMSFSGSNRTLTARVFRPTVSEVVAETNLHDDGVAPDLGANDSTYSAQIQFTVQRAFAGRYRVQISARTTEGIVSNILEKSFKLTRRNSAPRLTNVSSPDSVNLPTSGFITVQFTAAVADSDGLADIQQVFFQRIEPVDTSNTKFALRDDGSLGPESNIGGILVRSGDDIAGDGNFSFLIPVTPSTPRRTNVFSFHAMESFGDTSNVIQRSFTIR